MYKNIYVPYFGIGAKEVIASVFFIIGHLYKKVGTAAHSNVLLVAIALALVVIGTFYWQCSMLSLVWQKVIPYTISAVCGTLVCFTISNHISKSSGMLKHTMVYIGENTLSILTWHMLAFKLVSLLIISIYGLDTCHLSEFPIIESYSSRGWWVLYLLVGVFVPLFINIVFKSLKNGFISNNSKL